MNAGIQSGRDAPPTVTGPATASVSPGQEAQASARFASLLSPRTTAASVKAPIRSAQLHEASAAAAGMPERLAAALPLCRAALANTVALFDCVSRGEAVPISLAEQTVSDLLGGLDRDSISLLSLIRLKAHGDYACMHSVAVCALMAALARQMGFDDSQRQQAALAGLLHDVGKALIPSDILAKPGRLTDAEYTVVKGHPQHGFDLLTATGGIADAIKDVAHHHHERPDGRGYPHRLAGDEISVLSRMGAICDVYDAITSNRPYKDGWDPAAAMRAMALWAEDGQFDVDLTAAFTAMMGIYPIGSLVRLRSERLAVVSSKPTDMQPWMSVTAFYCLRTRQMTRPEKLDLGAPHQPDSIVDLESNSKWRFRGLDSLWAGNLAQQLHGV